MKEQETDRRLQNIANKIDPLYETRKFELTRMEARDLPVFQQKITLTGKQMTFPQVLQSLHQKYGISYVCDPQRYMPQRADIKIPSLPLGDALDYLTGVFHDTEWEWRKYNVLIVRGPLNPARDKTKGMMTGTTASEKNSPP